MQKCLNENKKLIAGVVCSSLRRCCEYHACKIASGRKSLVRCSWVSESGYIHSMALFHMLRDDASLCDFLSHVSLHESHVSICSKHYQTGYLHVQWSAIDTSTKPNVILTSVPCFQSIALIGEQIKSFFRETAFEILDLAFFDELEILLRSSIKLRDIDFIWPPRLEFHIVSRHPVPILPVRVASAVAVSSSVREPESDSDLESVSPCCSDEILPSKFYPTGAPRCPDE